MVSAAGAEACTLCHSRIADEVRAALSGADLWSNVAALLCPAAVLMAAVFLLRRYMP
jgi:hypothetical protein